MQGELQVQVQCHVNVISDEAKMRSPYKRKRRRRRIVVVALTGDVTLYAAAAHTAKIVD